MRGVLRQWTQKVNIICLLWKLKMNSLINYASSHLEYKWTFYRHLRYYNFSFVYFCTVVIILNKELLETFCQYWYIYLFTEIRSTAMLEITCNDRLGKKVRVKCKYPFWHQKFHMNLYSLKGGGMMVNSKTIQYALLSYPDFALWHPVYEIPSHNVKWGNWEEPTKKSQVDVCIYYRINYSESIFLF